jgi:hypothetical protein
VLRIAIITDGMPMPMPTPKLILLPSDKLPPVWVEAFIVVVPVEGGMIATLGPIVPEELRDIVEELLVREELREDDWLSMARIMTVALARGSSMTWSSFSV